ncbi:HAD family hydrolase [Lonsdalea quercina]|uniref:HAD family hydrolase n=1 Tax=Lonsdalea quercina TaxID=71657 RepID=UPI0039770D75
MVKMIIFDIDDTLLDHRAGAMEAMSALKQQLAKLNYINEKYDFSIFINAYERRNHMLWSQFEIGKIAISDVLKKRFDHIFDWFDIRMQHKLIFKEIFWENYISNCHLTHDWISLLQQLQSDFHLVICSNGMKEIQLKKLEQHKIITFFDRFYFGDTHPNCKPNIDFFIRILEEFQLTPQQAIMVGDSLENDVLPCQKLGMKTLKYDGKESFQKIYKKLTELKNGSKTFI